MTKKLCGGWLDDAWSSNLQNFVFQVSSKKRYWSCALRQCNQWNLMSMAFNTLGIILLVSSACAVELLVCMGVQVCGCPTSLRVRRMETAVLALMNSAPSLASAADDITALIICDMLSTTPLLMGMSSLPAMIMWPLALLQALGSDRYNASLWIASLMSLVQYVMIASSSDTFSL